MGSYDAIAGLPVEVDDYVLERRELAVSSGFTRVTTTITMRGGGVEGQGEDVIYDAAEQDALQAATPIDVRHRGAFDELASRLAAFEHPYRRWAFESAVLDLALRQAGRSLGEALGRSYRPVRFVVSTRQDPWALLERLPETELKLDPEPSWTRAELERLAATGRVRCLDLKSYYTGTAVDNPPDRDLYRACVELFGDETTIEDAWLEDGFAEILAPARHRLSFDAPIHGVADIDALLVQPQRLNIKPSRIGPIANLMETLDACAERGIALYGGGQFELGIGRSHIQALASLFYADGASDVAPVDYHVAEPHGDLPRSPLQPSAAPQGLAL